MKRLLRRAGPLLWALLIGAALAAAIAHAVEAYYQMPLRPENVRLQRPWALGLGGFALLALIARGWLYRMRLPRLRVSHGADISRLTRRGFRLWLKDCLTGARAVAVALLGVALAGPQSIHARDSAEVEGIDIVLTLDLSLSMRAADIEPNRFAATKQVVNDFIVRRPNDRFGAVIFGRDAFTLLPLTTDHQALRGMISELQLNLIDGQGTAIGNAIGTALNRLRESEAKSKVVILATDGDSNSGNVTPVQAAEFASALGVKIYTILMGRSDQAPVQLGVDLFGRPLFDRGSFPINPELLKTVADRTGGQSFEVSDRQGLERSFHTILNALEKSEIEDAGRVYSELFPVLVLPALLLLLLEALLGGLVLRRWP